VRLLVPGFRIKRLRAFVEADNAAYSYVGVFEVLDRLGHVVETDAYCLERGNVRGKVWASEEGADKCYRRRLTEFFFGNTKRACCRYREG